MNKESDNGFLSGFIKQVIDPIFDSFKGLTEAIEKHSEKVAPLLQKAKLWYFPSMPMSIYESLWHLSEQETEIAVEQIEQIFIDFYDKNDCENLKEMVWAWFDTPIFARRKHIIEDALSAHKSGKFTLSVPALLPQVEGSLRDYFTDPQEKLGKLLEKAVMNVYIDNAKTVNSLSDDILLALANDPFLFKGGLGKSFTSDKYREWMTAQDVKMIPLNRDTILHGIQLDYGTKANSLRVFFLLDSIHLIASELIHIILDKR